MPRAAPAIAHPGSGVVPRPQGQNRRAEADLAVTGGPAVPRSRIFAPRDLDRADASRNRSRRAETMPHDAGAPVGKLQILLRGRNKKERNVSSWSPQPAHEAAELRRAEYWSVDRRSCRANETKGNKVASSFMAYRSP